MLFLLVSSTFNSRGEGRSPGLSISEAITARVFLWNVGIPYSMQIGRHSTERNVDGVAANVEGFVMQRLVDITNELIEQI